ncbi:hypothetical protein [Actinomyces vulturis]|uniref:hypothetical protein n=1 Tax=Actinomyces vulturis TaxID=1857645 RepID=UPI00082C453D|nr:hypothetical protein [Actinomyces vulturis]
MSNTELLPAARASAPVLTSSGTQNGDHNVMIGHAEVVNVVGPQGLSRLTRNIATSRKYYQLLVSEHFSPHHRSLCIPANEALTDGTSAEDKQRLSRLDEPAVRELLTFPALLMNPNQNHGKANVNQLAFYGYLTSIEVCEGYVRVAYCTQAELPQQALNDLKDSLCLQSAERFNELNLPHWAVKSVNLVSVLHKAGFDMSSVTSGSAA